MVLRERSVPTLKVGLEQWNFTTVGVSEICPMDWAYYPFCGRGGKSPKHHKSPPGLECWNSSMMREAAGAVPLLKEKCWRRPSPLKDRKVKKMMKEG